jgi:hypothetical protein
LILLSRSKADILVSLSTDIRIALLTIEILNTISSVRQNPTYSYEKYASSQH